MPKVSAGTPIDSACTAARRPTGRRTRRPAAAPPAAARRPPDRARVGPPLQCRLEQRHARRRVRRRTRRCSSCPPGHRPPAPAASRPCRRRPPPSTPAPRPPDRATRARQPSVRVRRCGRDRVAPGSAGTARVRRQGRRAPDTDCRPACGGRASPRPSASAGRHAGQDLLPVPAPLGGEALVGEHLLDRGHQLGRECAPRPRRATSRCARARGTARAASAARPPTPQRESQPQQPVAGQLGARVEPADLAQRLRANTTAASRSRSPWRSSGTGGRGHQPRLPPHRRQQTPAARRPSARHPSAERRVRHRSLQRRSLRARLPGSISSSQAQGTKNSPAARSRPRFMLSGNRSPSGFRTYRTRGSERKPSAISSDPSVEPLS